MNLNNKHPHSYHRKKLIRQLLEAGYSLGKVPEPVNDPALRWMDGPSPDSDLLEHDLKRFHVGESFYRVESFATRVNFLGVRAYHHSSSNSPHHEQSISLEEARQTFYDWLISGYEFRYGNPKQPSYGMCRLIDFVSPDVNRLRVFEGWQGVRRNGFAWDLIISINSLPIAAVIYGNKGDLLNTAIQAREELDADPVFGTFVQFLIVTDGHSSYMGSPTDAPTNFAKWTNIFDDILSPKQIYDLLYYGIRPGIDEDSLAKFVIDAQQKKIVQRLNERIRQYLDSKHKKKAEPQCLGYVLAMNAENNIRHPSPFGWMGAIRQMVYEQHVYLSDTEDRVRIGFEDAFTQNTEIVLLAEDLSEDECQKLMQDYPRVHFIRFINRTTGPYLIDEKNLGPAICKIETPLETLEYESEAE